MVLSQTSILSFDLTYIMYVTFVSLTIKKILGHVGFVFSKVCIIYFVKFNLF